MDKLDLVRTDRAYYAPPVRPVAGAFGPLPYLIVDGSGAPGGPGYTLAVEALFGLAWALKFRAKTQGRDFVVAKLEGQWWWPDDYAGRTAEEVPRDLWSWRLRIRLPAFVDASDIEVTQAAKGASRAPGSTTPRVGFAVWDEGPCVQILHTGPYATEPATLALVHEYMEAHGLVQAGHHHEIYLTDPRRGDPAKAKTVLRLPVSPAGVPRG